MVLTAVMNPTGTRHIHGATEKAQVCGFQYHISTSTQEVHQEIRTEVTLPLSHISLNVNQKEKPKRLTRSQREIPGRLLPNSQTHAQLFIISPGCHGLTRAVTFLFSFLLTVSSWDPAVSRDVNAVYSSSYLTSLEKRTSQA